VKDSHHASPGWRQYVGIAFLLGVLTLIELWAANLPDFKVPVLLILTVIKASMVALWYMHLKFDSRLYSALFAGAIVIFAIPLTIILMILFQSAL
jgi:cytochrome c oxidase subunit IV